MLSYACPHLYRRLLHAIPIRPVRHIHGGRVVKVPLDFGDAVLRGEQPFAEEALQHGLDGRPMHQLEDEQVGLQDKVRLLNNWNTFSL